MSYEHIILDCGCHEFHGDSLPQPEPDLSYSSSSVRVRTRFCFIDVRVRRLFETSIRRRRRFREGRRCGPALELGLLRHLETLSNSLEKIECTEPTFVTGVPSFIWSGRRAVRMFCASSPPADSHLTSLLRPTIERKEEIERRREKELKLRIASLWYCSTPLIMHGWHSRPQLLQLLMISSHHHWDPSPTQ